MKRILSVAVFALASALSLAAVSPLLGGGKDLTKIPDPSAREKELSAKPITLAKAIETVAKDGGVISSAAFSASGLIEVNLIKGGLEYAVVVDSTSGAVITSTPVPLFPGDAVSGPGTTTASGLRYYDLKVGEGAEAIAKTSTATVHYTGWLLDGSQFDSSIPRKQPFPVNLARGGVIEGWLQGIPGMKAGGKRKLVIPGNLAYGPGGRPGIPPNAVLVFDVELLSVN